MLGLLWGADPRALRQAEEALELAIYQTAWDPEYLRQHMVSARAVAEEQRRDRLRDARLLDKVASYSKDADDDFSPAAAPQRPRPAPAGVTDAWKRDDG